MSLSQAPTATEYSIEDGDEDLRTAFDEEFEWGEDGFGAEMTADCTGYCKNSHETCDSICY